MTSISTNDDLFAAIQDPDQWPDEVDGDLAFELRTSWIEEVAKAKIENFYLAERWISRSNNGPVPIGREAIRADIHLRILGRYNQEELTVAAPLPGSEFLYFPVRGEIAGSMCELLFLASSRTEESSFLPFRGVFTSIWWTPEDMAFRITGYPSEKPVQSLMTNARKWWATFSGKRLPAGGRPRVTVTYEIASEVHRWLWEQSGGYDRVTGTYEKPKKPGNEAVVEELQSRGFQIEISTFYTRISEWRNAGKQWPPVNL